MSVDGIPLLPIIQMGHVEKVVEDLQNSPQMQQHAAQDAAQKTLDTDKNLVQQTDPSVDAKNVNPDDQKRQQQHQEKKRNAQAEEPEENASGKSTGSWSGIIVNTKV